MSITKVKNLQKVVAVEVNTGKHIDGKMETGGRFLVENLPDGQYFLMLKGENDVLEGMRFPDDVYAGKPLTAQDRADLEKAIRKMEEFMHDKYIWRIDGGSQRAIAFVYHERTKDWFLNAGDHITDKIARRLDYFMFRRAGQEWKLVQYYMLHREEVPRSAPPTWQHHYADALGGIELNAKHPQAVINY